MNGTQGDIDLFKAHSSLGYVGQVARLLLGRELGSYSLSLVHFLEYKFLVYLEF